MNEVSGGIGAVSIALSEPVLLLILLVVVLFASVGVWKLAKLLWLALSG